MRSMKLLALIASARALSWHGQPFFVDFSNYDLYPFFQKLDVHLLTGSVDEAVGATGSVVGGVRRSLVHAYTVELSGRVATLSAIAATRPRARATIGSINARTCRCDGDAERHKRAEQAAAATAAANDESEAAPAAFAQDRGAPAVVVVAAEAVTTVVVQVQE